MAMPVGAPPSPLLISVKAVDPDVYPFYGTVTFNPPMDLCTALRPDTIAVADGVLLCLNAHIGGHDSGRAVSHFGSARRSSKSQTG